MKTSLAYAADWLLICIASHCTIGALVSAFSFDVPMGGVFFILAVSSAAAVIITKFYRSKGLIIILAAAAFLILWNRGRISGDLKFVVHVISSHYSKWTPVPVLFTDAAQYEFAPSYFFTFLGIAIICFLTFAICFKRSALLTAMVTLPMVFLSFVLIDTKPSNIYLLLLIASYLSLVLGSSTIEYENEDKSGLPAGEMIIFSGRQPRDFFRILTRPAARYAISIALSVFFVIFVYFLTPPSGYERSHSIESVRLSINNIATDISRIFMRIPASAGDSLNKWFTMNSDGIWMFSTNRVDVANAGERIITNRGLLEIKSSQPGTFYLRGFSMSSFRDGSWRSATGNESLIIYNSDQRAMEMPARIAYTYAGLCMDGVPQYFADYYAGTPGGNVPAVPVLAGMSVSRINDRTDVDYVPYFSGSSSFFTNPVNDLSDYDMLFYRVTGPIRELCNDYVGYMLDYTIGQSSNIIDLYTHIDDYTAAGLMELAAGAGINPGADRAGIADAVAAYVRSAGRYTLAPRDIPDGEDFALYFLQTSREGYCIHFATAATLMLRALDIPARFVSGYVAQVSPARAGLPVVLSDANAHAWVEVFYDDAGWLPLEVTPSGRGINIPEPTPHAPPQTLPPAPGVTPDIPVRPELSPSPSPRPSPSAAPGSSPPPRPGGTGTGTGAGGINEPVPRWFINLVIFTVAASLLIAALRLRAYMAAKNREKNFAQQDTNAAVLYMWRYILKISRSQSVPPTDIEDIALKARFSQHRISRQERDYMLAYTNRLALEIYSSKDTYSRLWFKYIRGL